jgi:NAD-dependent deacetylase sirtuin 4
MRISIPTLPLHLANSSTAPFKAPSLQDVKVAAERLATFLEPRGAVVITGAGVSVESGIKAYRGNDGRYANPNFK